MGRPRLDASAKDVLIGARFGPEEAKQVERTAKTEKQTKSELVRQRLLHGNRIPVKCPHAQESYDQKPAVFYFMDGEERIALKGKFRVWLEPTCIAIVVSGMKNRVAFDQFFHLSQTAVDSIRPYPEDPEVWEIQEPTLFAPTH